MLLGGWTKVSPTKIDDRPILKLNGEQIRVPVIPCYLPGIILHQLYNDTQPIMQTLVIRVRLVRDVNAYAISFLKPSH